MMKKKSYYVEITGVLPASVPFVVSDAGRFYMIAYRYDYALRRFTAEFSNPTDCLYFNDYVAENYTFSSLGMFHHWISE